jgi:predicted HicB family RNase H-like nuclease
VLFGVILLIDNSIPFGRDGLSLMEHKRVKRFTIRIPMDVYERISILSTKRLCSLNKWIVHTIERESKPR